jgi:hypothetical protein
MSRTEKSHLRGQRGQAFVNKIRGINPEQILCVSLDSGGVSTIFYSLRCLTGLEFIPFPTPPISLFFASYFSASIRLFPHPYLTLS